MRTIKFRAWDKINNRWHWEPEDEIFINAEVKPNGKFYLNDKSLSGYHNAELMQFTGLLDKNGKEIYEGDIVRIPEGYGGDLLYKPFAGVVEYDIGSPPGFYINQSKNIEKTGKWCGQEYGWNEIEVIGNIYDSPELL